MNIGLMGPPLRQRRRLSKAHAILAAIMGLLAFYPLTGCGSWGSMLGVTGSNTTIATPAQTSTIMTTATSTQQTSPWKLTWSDEFDGAAGTPPDPSKWSLQIGRDGGNGQMDYDTNDLAYQDGQGNMIIEARKGNPKGFQCWYGPCQYTSAFLTTKGHFNFTYGRLEARIKLPYGQGIWPSFWMDGSNCDTVGWPACGEVDIMENIGREPATIYGTVHGPKYSTYYGTYKLPQGTFADGFHVFALQWDPNHLYFFMDGINYYTLNRASVTNQQDWVYDHPFYIILNLAIGGTWPGNPDASTVFPQKMYISYVRFYANA
ncbi:MAG: glycoside hydrolase family 16 protein [Ktedonobacteraceae bacterium]